MIRTKDIEEFIDRLIEKNTYMDANFLLDYRREIIKRLQAFDKLKEAIEKMVKNLEPHK